MNIYDTANKLAQEIKQSEEYITYKTAKEAISLNVELKKQIEEFEKASYSIWAIDELKSYIADRLYPRRSGSINEFIKYTNDFIELVSRYSKITPASQLMFSAARNVATNVNDLFRAMK